MKIQRSQATVKVKIMRNEYTPSFTNLPASITINETVDRDAEIFTIESSDRDDVDPFFTTSYTLIGDDLASNFFSIDDVTGLVSVIGRIKSTPGENVVYKVRRPCLEEFTIND